MLYRMGHQRHERYWKKFLMPGEKVLRTFGVSGRYLFVFWWLPVLLLAGAAVALSFWIPLLGVLLLLVAVLMVVPALYLTFFVHYAVTDSRVMSREGLLHKRMVTVRHDYITDITVNETIMERLLTNTGSLGLNTAGSQNVELHLRHINGPLKVKSDVYKHWYAVSQQPGPRKAPSEVPPLTR